MPKLLSFDIGIKNFAYCIFDFTPEEKETTIKILDWNVLDISKTSSSYKKEEIFFCSCFLSKKTKKKDLEEKDKEKCNKKAKYQKGNDYFCEKHAKLSGFLFPSKKEFSHSSLKKLSLEKLLEIEHKYFLILENLNLEKIKETKIQKVERIYQQLQQKTLLNINIQETGSDKNIDLITIGRNLEHQLGNLNLENIEYVLIENQISPIANKMKTIQGMVAQIFIMRNVPNIEFISSINKLRGFVSSSSSSSSPKKLKTKTKKDLIEENILGEQKSLGEEKEGEKKEKEKPNPNYKQHKKDGILYCQQWLKNDFFCSWNSYFENFKNKQDDLADCFLQGIWYFKKMGILREDMKVVNNNAVNININNVH